MAALTYVVSDPRCRLHCQNEYHVESPDRVIVIDDDLSEIVDPRLRFETNRRLATDDELRLVHSSSMIKRAKTKSAKVEKIGPDVMANEHTYTSALAAVGSVLTAVDLVLGRQERTGDGSRVVSTDPTDAAVDDLSSKVERLGFVERERCEMDNSYNLYGRERCATCDSEGGPTEGSEGDTSEESTCESCDDGPLRSSARLGSDVFRSETKTAVGRSQPDDSSKPVPPPEPRPRYAFCNVRPPGHHASATASSGFCVFNNVAIGVRYAQKKHGVGKAAIMDWDVHHGNGTQSIFANDPTVLYVSLHQSPLYPGTGLTKLEDGCYNYQVARGSDMNLFSVDYREALRVIRGFGPEMVFVSCGFDMMDGDALGGLRLKARDVGKMTEWIKDLGVPVVSVLEGGYDGYNLRSGSREHVLAFLKEATTET